MSAPSAHDAALAVSAAGSAGNSEHEQLPDAALSILEGFLSPADLAGGDSTPAETEITTSAATATAPAPAATATATASGSGGKTQTADEIAAAAKAENDAVNAAIMAAAAAAAANKPVVIENEDDEYSIKNLVKKASELKEEGMCLSYIVHTLPRIESNRLISLSLSVSLALLRLCNDKT